MTPATSLIGGFYAKAKQRVLNKIGRRTTLTRNPRVDFISKRVEEIKSKKSNVSMLANNAKTQLNIARKAIVDLDRAMLEAYKAELGDRKWDEEKGTYTRVLHPEEKRMVNDMERVMARCMETMDRVLGSYSEHLDDTSKKPLTFNTPDEESKLEVVMETKDQYKVIRTLYSDQMIDADADLAAGKDLSEVTKEKMAETKERYDSMSERLCEDALKYEQIYREELAQRVSAHFTAEQQLLRGVASAMKDLYPYTRGLTLDWEEMRVERKNNLAEARKTGFEGEFDVGGPHPALPPAGAVKAKTENGDDKTEKGNAAETTARSANGGDNPFDNIQNTAVQAASQAASTLGKVGKIAQSNVNNLMNQYGPSKAKVGDRKSVV